MDKRAVSIALAAFGEEVNEAAARLQAEDTGFFRRAYVRAWFASIEGTCFVLKQKALELLASHLAEQNKRGVINVPAADFMFLDETDFQLGDDGNIKPRSARIRTLPNVLYTFQSIAKQIESTHTLSKGNGWQAFQEAVNIRDRITHPKTGASLDITDEDLETIRRADHWFRGELNAILINSPKVPRKLAQQLSPADFDNRAECGFQRSGLKT